MLKQGLAFIVVWFAFSWAFFWEAPELTWPAAGVYLVTGLLAAVVVYVLPLLNRRRRRSEQ